MDFDINQIRSLVRNSDLEESLTLLEETTCQNEDLKKNMLDIIIGRQAQYINIKRDRLRGIISHEEFRIYENDLVHIILELSNEIQSFLKESSSSEEKDNYLRLELDQLEKRIRTKRISNHVLIIGMPGSGKTTFLASIANFLGRNYGLNYHNQDQRFFELKDITKGFLLKKEDLPPSQNNDLIELNISLKDPISKVDIPLSFFEWGVKSNGQSTNDDYQVLAQYIEPTFCYLIIIERKDFSLDQYFYDMINFLLNKETYDVGVAIIITKWDGDLSENNSFYNYFLDKFPMLVRLVIEKGVRVFRHSIFDDENSNKIFEWMIMQVNGTSKNMLSSINAIKDFLEK